MSKSDDKTGPYGGRGNGFGYDPMNPSRSGHLSDDMRHRQPQHMEQKRQNQGEYSHVGGQRLSNQQYPVAGNAQGQYSDPSGRHFNGQNNVNTQNTGAQHPLIQQGYPNLDSADHGQYSYPQPSAYQYPQPARPSLPRQGAQTSFNHPGYDNQLQSAPVRPSYSQANYNGPQSSMSQGLGSGLQVPSRSALFSDPMDPASAREGGGFFSGYNAQDYNSQSRYSNPSQYDGAYAQDGYGQTDSEDYYGAEDPNSDYYDHEYGEDYQKAKPKKGRLAMVVTSLVVMMGAGVGGVYAYQKGWIGKGNVQQASDKPLVISADKDPVKIKPNDPGGKAIGNTEKQIYDRLAGKPNEAPEAERLVSRQEPENLATASTTTRSFTAPQGESKPQSGQSIVMAGNTGGGEAEASAGAGVGGFSLSQSANEAEATQQNSGGPRSVKTYLVRPDGTMMSSPSEAAEAEQKVASVDSGQTQTDDKVPVVDIPERGSMVSSSTDNTVAVGDVSSSSNDQQQEKVSSLVIKNEEDGKNKTRSFSTEQQGSEAKPEAKANDTTVTEPSAATGKFAIQVAARQDHTGALETFANLQQKHPSLIGSYGPVIQRADLGAKGVWYRLLIGPMDSKTDASELCTKLKSAGVSSCFVKGM